MKTFFTLAVAFVLGNFAAFGLVGCNADANKPPIPKVDEKKPADDKKEAAPAAKTDEKKGAFWSVGGGQARV